MARKARNPLPVLAVLVAGLLAAGLLAAIAVQPSDRVAPATGSPPRVDAPQPRAAKAPQSVYGGLGAWVDAFDYAPAYHRPWEGPLLGPEAVDAMAARGVRTLYLQAARLDPRSPDGIVDAALVGSFLERAHDLDLRVVGWYLPKFGDVEVDLTNLRRVRDFEFRGHRFDGIGVDIEWRRDVADDAERSRRLVELSRRLRRESERHTLAAIVYPPVLLEAVYPNHWPGFPWSELAAVYDVWLPMTYWTETTVNSGYHQGYRYTGESVRALRARLGDPFARVHPVGGVAGDSRPEEFQGFVQAALETGALGLSLYDYRTTPPAGWEALRRGVAGP